MSETSSACPGCGLQLPLNGGETHPYIGASPACWALYGVVLAREYGDPEYMRIHQLTVDTYAVQHPGLAEARSIRSVWGHLASLHMQIEQRAPAAVARTVIKRVAAEADSLGWLVPPRHRGSMTIAEVARALSSAEHSRLVTAWARNVWAAWAEHHGRVAQVVARTNRCD